MYRRFVPLETVLTAAYPHNGCMDLIDLHHAHDDTLDKVDPKELAQNVAVWTAFLYTVADSDIDFRKLATEAK